MLHGSAYSAFKQSTCRADSSSQRSCCQLCITECYMHCRHSRQQPMCSVPPFKACLQLGPTPLYLYNSQQSKTQSPLAWTGLQSLAMAATSMPRLPSGDSWLHIILFTDGEARVSRPLIVLDMKGPSCLIAGFRIPSVMFLHIRFL